MYICVCLYIFDILVNRADTTCVKKTKQQHMLLRISRTYNSQSYTLIHIYLYYMCCFKNKRLTWQFEKQRKETGLFWGCCRHLHNGFLTGNYRG